MWPLTSCVRRWRSRRIIRDCSMRCSQKGDLSWGVSPIPTGPTSALAAEVQDDYENAIREAGRRAGLALDNGNILAAWIFQRMLGEPEPIGRRCEKIVPAEVEDCQQLIDIAYHQGLCPQKGFDLALERLGICNAITMVSSHEFPHGPVVRDYCIKRLVRALHAELVERIACAIEQVQERQARGSHGAGVGGRACGSSRMTSTTLI